MKSQWILIELEIKIRPQPEKERDDKMVETWISITTNGVYICRTSLERNAALATTRQRVARRVERRPGSHLQQYSLAPMTVEHGYRYIGATARNEITG